MKAFAPDRNKCRARVNADISMEFTCNHACRHICLLCKCLGKLLKERYSDLGPLNGARAPAQIVLAEGKLHEWFTSRPTRWLHAGTGWWVVNRLNVSNAGTMLQAKLALRRVYFFSRFAKSLGQMRALLLELFGVLERRMP